MMTNYEMNTEGRAFGWDEEIRNDGPDYVLLPAGEYPFEIVKFERSRYPGGPKLPPCAMAVLTVRIDGGDKGQALLTDRLYLHTRTEGMLCAFFESIGQRAHGQALVPRWNEVTGSRGLCRVGVREYTTKDGSVRSVNEITRYLPQPAPTAAPAKGWTQGAF